MASTHAKKQATGSHVRLVSKSGVDDLFSEKVTREKKTKRGRKKELPPTDLPKDLAKICDLFAAGKAVLKEIDYKIDFASQRLREYALRGFVRLFVSTKRKPPSMDYVGQHSRLKFVQTRRTTLTVEKADYLRSLGIPVDEYTELAGIEMNMAEISRHGLVEKVREGLANLGVAKAVLEECFETKHELTSAFYENLYSIVRDSLQKDEDLEEKMLDVMTTLNPAEQLRNVEIKDLDVRECFDLILKTEIEVDESEAA